jgi:hypothetical protein
MTDAPTMHPAELSYVFSYLKTGVVVGWGAEPFAAPTTDADAWFETGRDRLTKSGRLVPGKQKGRHRFSDEVTRIAATLSDPQIVILTQRREVGGVRTMTHHLSGKVVVEATRRPDGDFAVLELPSLNAAAGASAAFVGAADDTPPSAVRIEANQKVFDRMRELAAKGAKETAAAALVKLGASPAAARSALAALGAPASGGVVSVLYCAANSVQDAETYTVLTSKAGESWVLFPPAAPDGPVVLERTSVASLAARILVAIATRAALPM